MTSPPIRLLDHDLFVFLVMHEKQKKRCGAEEYNVHDPKRERGLQHCTGAVEIEGEGRLPTEPVIVEGNIEASRS